MNIVVTGGLGYLGRHVVDILLSKNYNVTIIDAMIYGNKDFPKNVQVVKMDIKDSKVYDFILGSDALIHLAALVGDKVCELSPEDTISINQTATENLANFCAKNGIKFVFTSTCSIFGTGGDISIKENENKAKPISLYGRTKLGSEKAILSIPNLNYSILRLGTLFGWSPRMRFDLVINRFIAQALSKNKLVVLGGDQWRPFIHVKDAAELIVDSISKEKYINNLATFNMQIINIARELSELTLIEFDVFEKIEDKRDYKVQIVNLDKFKEIEYALNEIKGNQEWQEYGNFKYDNYNYIKLTEFTQ